MLDYYEFLENYPEELQLLDALDALENYSISAAETLDRLVSPSTNGRSDAKPLQIDPIP